MTVKFLGVKNMTKLILKTIAVLQADPQESYNVLSSQLGPLT